MKYIREIETMREFISNGLDLSNCTFQNVDFMDLAINWAGAEIKNTYFLGCNLSPAETSTLIHKGAFVFLKKPDLPYNPFRESLYSVDELMDGYSTREDLSVDKKIYDHFFRTRYNPDVNESLWQRIHDHAIDDALRELVQMGEDGMTGQKVIAIMGGHSTLRTDPNYEKIVFIAKELTEKGFLLASGGGPGIMEATNLGAYMAGYSNQQTKEVITSLGAAPHYTDEGYIEIAQEVRSKYQSSNISLAIPTWFYGHEPSNMFSSQIAKYFSNSIREDVLLSVALYGVIFAPGRAGTFQEIFMDVAQNYYGTFRYFSPMIFLDRTFYENDTFIYPVVRKIAEGKDFNNLLFVSDEIDEIITFVQNHSPVEVK